MDSTNKIKIVTNQATPVTELARRLTIIVLCASILIGASVVGVYLYQVSDPYIQSVLTAPRDPERGEAIFQINCAGCHGVKADGNVGPGLHNISERKSELKLIQQVTSGDTPPMPKFQPQPQEMSDLLGYLETL